MFDVGQVISEVPKDVVPAGCKELVVYDFGDDGRMVEVKGFYDYSTGVLTIQEINTVAADG